MYGGAAARVFPARLGSRSVAWMWECGCRWLWAFVDAQRRCAHGEGSPPRLVVLLLSRLCRGDAGGNPGRRGVSETGTAVRLCLPPARSLYIFIWGVGGLREELRIPQQHHGDAHCRQREYQQESPTGVGSAPVKSFT